MRKAFISLLIFTLLGAYGAGIAKVEAAASPSITAEAAALIDVTSGRVLYAKQGDKSLPIASLTKIMTAVVALERGKLTDQVTVSKNAFGKEGSSIYLKLGEQMSLNNMLYGLMLRSGNDAATAIAEHVGGSLDGFVYMMNEKAQELGLSHSHFANPSGLDAAGHYSSANDLAKLTAYAMRNPVFREIVKTDVKKVPRPDEQWDAVWYNKNKMLSMYDGADGVKTGYTTIAKRCLVSSATRGGRQLVVVTLNDSNDWLDHRRLLDYGFEQYSLLTLASKGEKLQDGYVVGRTFQYAVTSQEKATVSRSVEWDNPGTVRQKLGQAGTVKLTVNGQQVGAVPIYPESSPLLKQSDDTAFNYKPLEPPDETAGFMKRLSMLVHALFAGTVKA